MGIQVHLALLWTRLMRIETKPLDQRGTSPRKNNTGVRKPRGRAHANPINKLGTAPTAAAMAHKHNLGTDESFDSGSRAPQAWASAAAPPRR